MASIELTRQKSIIIKPTTYGLDSWPLLVRLTGLEPALRKQLDPKSGASTNSATGALRMQR